jgi:hypothetical protein
MRMLLPFVIIGAILATGCPTSTTGSAKKTPPTTSRPGGDAGKADMGKPDEKKPDEKKPDEKKPEEKKPDEKKPDEKKP